MPTSSAQSDGSRSAARRISAFLSAVSKCGILSGRSSEANSRDAGLDEEVHQPIEDGEIDLPVLEDGCGHRREQAAMRRRLRPGRRPRHALQPIAEMADEVVTGGRALVNLCNRARTPAAPKDPRRHPRLRRRPALPAGPAGADQPAVPPAAVRAARGWRLRRRHRRLRDLAERHRGAQRPAHGRGGSRRRRLQFLGLGVAAVCAHGGAVLSAADRDVLERQSAVSRDWWGCSPTPDRSTRPAIRFTKSFGDVADDEVFGRLRSQIPAVAAARRLQGLTYCLIGGRSLGIDTTVIDPAQWMKQFGIDVDHVDQFELIRRAETELAQGDSASPAALEYLEKTVGRIHWTHARCAVPADRSDLLQRQVALYYAAIDLIEEFKYDFCGIKGQRELTEHFATADVAEAFLNDPYGPDGTPKPSVVCSTEADSDAALTMQIFKHLAGTPVLFADVRHYHQDLGVWDLCNSGRARDFLRRAEPGSGGESGADRVPAAGFLLSGRRRRRVPHRRAGTRHAGAAHPARWPLRDDGGAGGVRGLRRRATTRSRQLPRTTGRTPSRASTVRWTPSSAASTAITSTASMATGCASWSCCAMCSRSNVECCAARPRIRF